MKIPYFICFILSFLTSSQLIFSQKYPSDAGVINITLPPYNADNTGVNDVTAIINKAFNDYPSANRIFYFPEGTYLISGILQIPGSNPMNNHIEGDGADKTIIKLQDNCTGYSNSLKPKEMINFGLGVAQRFNQTVRDITFNTGTGNLYAIALKYTSNNEGGMFNVKIKSDDGNGDTGLDLTFVNENGPLLIKNVEVEGFNYGIKSRAQQNSQTFQHITLKNQKICGFRNEGQVISIEDFTSINTVQAINNLGGSMTIVGASLTGGLAEIDAINNSGLLYLRNTSCTGYGKLVNNNVGNYTNVDALSVTEWTSHQAVGIDDFPTTMLNLEIKETPDAIIDPFEQWAKIPTTNIGPSIQAAIDAGYTTIYFPYGDYKFADTILVRGKVQRFIGCGGSIGVGWRGTFKVVDAEGAPPVVVFEHFKGNGGSGNLITQASSRTVVMKSIIDGSFTNLPGTGDVYMEDVCAGALKLNKANIWARQLNVEPQGIHILNNGANLWILGLKTEKTGTIIETKNQGKTEVLGFFVYTVPDASPTDVMFVNNESQFSAAGGEECWGGGKPYNFYLEEIKCGVSKKLGTAGLPSGAGIGHAVCFLTSSIDTCMNVNVKEVIKSTSDLSVFPNPATDILKVQLETEISGKVSYTIFNIIGSPVHSGIVNTYNNNGFNTEISVESFPAGIYIIQVRGDQKYYNKVFEVRK